MMEDHNTSLAHIWDRFSKADRKQIITLITYRTGRKAHEIPFMSIADAVQGTSGYSITQDRDLSGPTANLILNTWRKYQQENPQ